MDLVAQFQVLARYNSWMNRRLYDVAGTLSDDERTRDLGAFFGSVHGTLNHLLLADRAWLYRFTDLTRRCGTLPANRCGPDILCQGQAA